MIRVLHVTGAYHPEISAAAVQVRAASAVLQGRAELSVLTTAVDPALPLVETIDGVRVYRVHIDVDSLASKMAAAVQLARHLFDARATYDLLHVHGFSQKNVPVTIAARVLRKPLVLTLHTAGQDEPAAVRRRGVLAWWAFRSPDLVMSVSPALAAAWRSAGLPANRVRVTPNGIDTSRFAPADDAERCRLRQTLGWPNDKPIVLFVGFFSRDKRPDLLFRAWQRLAGAPTRSNLVFVGATGSPYFEIDKTLADDIRRAAAAAGLADEVIFAEPTHDVDRYMRAADVYALPSIREANPLALLEAMSCGLACVATRLPGATDELIEDGRNGRLVPPDDENALAAALRETLSNGPEARARGARARETVLARYDIRKTADAWLSAYQAVSSSQT